MRRRKLPPPPPLPPPGWMYWFGELTKITTVERHAKRIIGNHDKLSRAQRDLANGVVQHFKKEKRKP